MCDVIKSKFSMEGTAFNKKIIFAWILTSI